MQLKLKSRKQLFWVLTSVYTLLLFVIVSISLISIRNNLVKESIEPLKKADALLNTSLQTRIDIQGSAILFLKEQTEWYINNQPDTYLKALQNVYQQYASSTEKYDQIRFLNMQGDEVVRVNFSNNEAYVVEKERLQNKSNRYYVQEMLNLPENAVYFSPLDLNVEKDTIEKPYKPMIRIGMPVFDNQHRQQGIVMLNFKADKLLDLVKNTAQASIGTLMLLNKNGYYFIGPDSTKEWGFMFPERQDKTFKLDFPDESKTIFTSERGIEVSKKGLFIFSSVFFPETMIHSKNGLVAQKHRFRDNEWKIVSYLSTTTLKGLIIERFNRRLPYFIFFTLLLLLLFWVLAGSIIARQKAIQLIQEQNVELHKINQELMESNATKNKLYSIISHDLRSPFNSILGFSRILYENIDELDNHTIKQSAQEIWESADSAYHLLSNLLTWTRVQNGKLTPVPEQIYVEWILSMVRSDLNLIAAQKEITLQFTEHEPVSLMADRNMMETVVRNLVSNAIKFSPRGSQIDVDYTTEGNNCIITVKDRGVGMSDELTASLFTVGANMSTPGTEKEGGTGLGLLICKEFVEINGGSIRVESELHKGTAFFVSLPINKESIG